MCNQSVTSIFQHLLANPHCAYNPNMFTILDTMGSELQLSVLELLYITEYWLALYKQKDFNNHLLFNSINYTATKPDLVFKKPFPIFPG